MTKQRAFFAALLLVLLANQSSADNLISWDSGQPVIAKVSVTVSGTISLDSGWSASGDATVCIWPDGGEITEYTATVCGTSWSTTINNHPAGTYKVLVQIDVTNSCTQESETICTEPLTFTVK